MVVLVGFFDIFRRAQPITPINAAVALALESPHQSTSLAKVAYADYLGAPIGEVTREAALRIPAIKKARDVIVSIAASLPLVEHTNGVAVAGPSWLTSTQSGISPWHRLAYVIDDLLFYDWSALAVHRDETGKILDAVRIPFDRWAVNVDGTVTVDGRPALADTVVMIPGNGSGGLLLAAPTIRGAAAVEAAWIGRVRNPVPIMELHQVGDDELTDKEVEALLDAWAPSLTADSGAIGFTDSRVELKVHGNVNTDLFESGRNAIVLDIARLTGIPASILDGSQSTASLTYSTTEGKRNEFLDYSLPMWLGPIEARLSLDDVSAAGSVIRFDKAALTTDTTPTHTLPLED